jgi:hypothetical protein
LGDGGGLLADGDFLAIEAAGEFLRVVVEGEGDNDKDDDDDDVEVGRGLDLPIEGEDKEEVAGFLSLVPGEVVVVLGVGDMILAEGAAEGGIEFRLKDVNLNSPDLAWLEGSRDY